MTKAEIWALHEDVVAMRDNVLFGYGDDKTAMKVQRAILKLQDSLFTIACNVKGN